ncbi:hypothetical protein [Bradyrhizobium sp. USDA 4452]
MFWRGMVLLVAAVLLCGCETTQRNGLDYAAMTQKVGPPKAGHGRVVMLREKDFANIADRAFEFQLDGVPVQGLKTGTYVYVDRPAGQLTANEAGFPGVTERAFAIQAGQTQFYLVRMSERKSAILASSANTGLLGLALSTAITSGYKNPGPLDFLPLEDSAARTTIAELRLAE